MSQREVLSSSFETEARDSDNVVYLDCGGSVPADEVSQSADLNAMTLMSSFEDSRDDAMIIFDWDDSLLPSSALASSVPGFPLASPTGEVLPELQKHALSVWSLLRAARQVARVAIVTSSTEGWVMESAARYLPDLDFKALVQELDIQIYYAGSSGQAGFTDSVILKRDAMVQALTSLPEGSEEAGIARLNAISVGDSSVTARALREILASWDASGLLACSPLCKTVKLVSSPTVAALSDELDRLSVWLEHMALSDVEFDLCIAQPVDITAKALELFCA